jgi:hypothetical protein
MSNIMDTIRSWAEERGMAKGAAEMGSTGTSHPSTAVDDQDAPAQEGARAAENESDVKAQIPGETVNDAKGEEAEGAGRGENAPVHDIGVESTATGESPAIETAGTKDSPDDPGTSHPAKVDGGEKYSALINQGDVILADLAVVQAIGPVEGEKQAESKDKKDYPEAKMDAEGEKKDEKAEEKKDEASCPKAAEDTSSSGSEPETKAPEADPGEPKAAEATGATATPEAEQDAREAGAKAAELVVKAAGIESEQVKPEDVIDAVIKAAAYDAELAAEYLVGYQKAAAGDLSGLEAVLPAGDAQLEEGSDVGSEEETAAVDEAAAGAKVDEATADEATADEATADEAAAGGDEAALNEIAEALVAAGVSPEQVLASAGADAGMAAEAAPPPLEVSAEDKQESKTAAMKDALLKAAAKLA